MLLFAKKYISIQLLNSFKRCVEICQLVNSLSLVIDGRLFRTRFLVFMAHSTNDGTIFVFLAGFAARALSNPSKINVK